MNGRGNDENPDDRTGTAKTQGTDEHAGLTDRLTDRLTEEQHDGRMAASLDSLGWPDGRMNRTAPGQRQYCLESGGNDAKKKTAALNRPCDARRFPAGPVIQARRRVTRGTCRRGAAQSGAALPRAHAVQAAFSGCLRACSPQALPPARMQAVEVLRLHARPCRNGSPRACRQPPPTHRPCGNGPSLPHAAASWGQPVTGPHAPGLPPKPPPGPPPKPPPWPRPETALQRRLSRDSAGDSAGDSAPKPVPGRRRPTRSLADPLPETPPGNPPQRRPTNIHRRIQLSRHGLSRRCARPRRCRFRCHLFRRCLFRHDPRTASDVTGPAVFPA